MCRTFTMRNTHSADLALEAVSVVGIANVQAAQCAGETFSS